MKCPKHPDPAHEICPSCAIEKIDSLRAQLAEAQKTIEFLTSRLTECDTEMGEMDDQYAELKRVAKDVLIDDDGWGNDPRKALRTALAALDKKGE